MPDCPFARKPYKQAEFLLKTLRSVVDSKVLDTVRYPVSTNAVGIFENLTLEQKQLLEQLSTYATLHDVQTYLNQLEDYLIPYPQVTKYEFEHKKRSCLTRLNETTE